MDEIVVKGAREHNLKNIDVVIPRNRLVVITGVSGSGKSSLAFDTIYAEGQRRYVESLSAYARQFLGRIDKPDVDYVEGLSPAICIDQKGVSHNPRSTVGTVTEIYDYLRLLFARIGKPHCPECGRPVQRQTLQQIVEAVMSLPSDNRIMILAPVVRDRKGEYKEIFEDARRKGFVRARVDGEIHDLSDEFNLAKFKRHTIEIVVDRLITGENLEASRVNESVETALHLSSGIVCVATAHGLQTTASDSIEENGLRGSRVVKGRKLKRSTNVVKDIIFSEQSSCPYCEINLGAIEPRTFSFNSPHGACPRCSGLGYALEPDPELIVPDHNLSLIEGAIAPWARMGTLNSWYERLAHGMAQLYDFSPHTPINQLPQSIVNLVLYGDPNQGSAANGRKSHHPHRWRRRRNRPMIFEGVVPNLMRRHKDTESEYVRSEIERYMSRRPCPLCEGQRLKSEALAVTICGTNIMEFSSHNIDGALNWIQEIQTQDEQAIDQNIALGSRDRIIANQILKEIETRLRFLLDVGLHYLSINRMSSTLSGGESQRIRLATQIGSGLMGVLYVCDEPTIGLHPADDYRLIDTLKRLRDLGNTVIIVEHDEAMMRAADHIIDLGPGAGEHGGHIVATGTIQDIRDNLNSLTGAYLSGRRSIPIPNIRRVGTGSSLEIHGARANNLKDFSVAFPLGQLICVTGVSGSGKSTLVNEVLYKKLAQSLYRARERPGDHDTILGADLIDKVVNIDQSPIGRTPRSNPATYTGAFTPIRELYSLLPEARVRGYHPGRFSFNVKGGRCEACEGAGYTQIEMQFLPDVTVPCEICKGMRYNQEALGVKFHDKSIADVLNMTISDALTFFWNFPRIQTRLQTLNDVGLGYIRLGQPATTLSGGEAQRVKLATELSRRPTGRTIYILDEPTTGLSFDDVASLMKVLHRLVDGGSTVVVIEHHLDVIKNADWIIDLGPGAGDQGGWVIAQGTPEIVAESYGSSTAEYLKPYLLASAVTQN